MSKFDEISFNSKCDVCSDETSVVVCASSMGAVSYKYCKECLNKGLEPYGSVVSYISCAGKFPDNINPKYVEYIRKLLKGLGKTEDEFILDVDKAIEGMNEWYKDMEEDVDNEGEEE